MNKAITDGIDFMPPAFIDGLDDWSREDGTPGTNTYVGAADAALVASDPDFGPCLELQKTESVQRLRYMGEVPILPGVYLRVRARIKVMSGLFPSIRVAGWAGSAVGAHVTGLDETGPEILPATYGRVYEVSAIVGTGNRTGVDMQWGGSTVYGHFGIDLLGSNGGIVRVESIEIEDVTSVFHRNLMGWVDVRDYGAVGDGVTDDTLAFEAADADANGRELVVSPGVYFLGETVTLSSRCRFEGRVVMPSNKRLQLTNRFDLPIYIDAFGDEVEGLKRALAALFNFSGHESLDMKGRRVQLTAPLDLAAIAGKTGYANRRVIRNGQLEAEASPAWDTVTTISTANWSLTTPDELTNVTNIENIAIGALVSGNGMGREVYVKAKNEVAGTLTLSQKLINPSSTQSYTFQRFQYILDCSGFSDLSRFQVDDIEFLCFFNASGILLPKYGASWHIRDCWFTRPKDRGIASFDAGCFAINIDNCEFLSTEYNTLAQERTTIAISLNSNDVRIRNNHAIRFRHFAFLSSALCIISGNHFWQGDNTASRNPTAGIVFTDRRSNSTLVSNYIDNCYIEVTNEHSPLENGDANSPTFGDLIMTGNMFVAADVPNWFTFLRIMPYGNNHRLSGINMTHNTFNVFNGSQIDRVESLNLSNGSIDHSASEDIVFEYNVFNGVTRRTQNPAFVEVTQPTALAAWPYDHAQIVPFGGRVLSASSITALGPIQNAANVAQFSAPYVSVNQGAAGQAVAINWAAAVKGRVALQLRSDRTI